MNEIKIKLLRENSRLPTKGNSTDACFDLYASTIEIIDGQITYGLGIATEMPEGKMAKVYPRSSVSRKDLYLANGTGIIDSGYRGEWMVKFNRTLYPIIYVLESSVQKTKSLKEQIDKELKEAKVWQIFKRISLKIKSELYGILIRELRNSYTAAIKGEKIYKIGDRIAQVELRDIGDIHWNEADALSNSDRGGGFGSTGD